MKAIKYTTGTTENNTLKSQNWLIGVGGRDFSPTSSTDYWAPIDPPINGYTIYLNKASGGPSIYVANNDSELSDYIDDNIKGVKNFAIPFNEWYTRRSDITEITDGSIIPPFVGARVWSSTINSSKYHNTLHRIWTNGNNEGIIGDLGNEYYRYYMWVRGHSGNNPTLSVQIDISDGASSNSITIGTATTWTLISIIDEPRSYNATKFFDFSIAGSDGDTVYISGIVIAAIDTDDVDELFKINTFPSYIDYGQTIKLSDLYGYPTGFKVLHEKKNLVITNSEYTGITTDSLALCLDAGFIPSYPRADIFWYDLINDNSGIISGATFNSNNNGSLSFNGSSDYFLINNVTVNTNTLEGNSVEQWIYWNGGSGDMPFSWFDLQFDMYFSAGGFGINNGSSLVYGTSSIGLSNTWIHYVCFFPNNWSSRRDDAKLWINGVNKTMSVFGGSFTNRTIPNPTTISVGSGYNGTPGSYAFDGRVAITRIYNKELTDDEVLQNYNAQKGRFGL